MNRLANASLTATLVVLGLSHCQGQEAKPGPDYEQLKAMEWIIGDWEAEWVVPATGIAGIEGYPPGAKIKSFCSYAWRENKNYIELTFYDKLDEKVLHQGFELVGVDPKSKKIIHWLYSKLGGNGTGQWSLEGKIWALKWSYTTPDGSTLEGVGCHEPVDADTYKWIIKENTFNGKRLADSELLTFRRSAKKSG